MKRLPVDIGSDIEGKVTGIVKFGAFIELPDGNKGLVHISQVADTYVTDVSKHLKIGDVVKVRVLAVKDGKYDLSIKQVGKQAWQQAPRRKKSKEDKEKPAPGTFEDKITKFLKQSEEKLSDWKRNLENKQSGKKKPR